MADTKLADDKKQLAADRAAREKQAAERAANAGTPTPTQEEADLLKLGNPVDLAPDGSPPDPNNTGMVASAAQKDMGAGHSAGYQTRAAAPAHKARE